MQYVLCDSVGIALLVAKGNGSGAWTGDIINNTVGVTGVALSGSTQASGIKVKATGTNTHTVMIRDNVVRQTNEEGIFIQNNDGSATLNASVFNNLVAEPGAFSFAGLNVDVGALAGDTSICNVVIGSAGTVGDKNDFSAGDPSNFSDVNFSTIGGATIKLSKNGSASSTAAGVIDDDNLNPATTNTGVSVVAGSLTLVTTLPTLPPAVAACTLPPLLFAQGGVEKVESRQPGAVARTYVPTANRVTAPDAAKRPVTTVTTVPVSQASLLKQADLDSVVSTALARWETTGLSTEQAAILSKLHFEVTALSNLRLGEASGNDIRVSSNAGGNGWFIDASAQSDSLFAKGTSSTRSYTDPTSAPAGRMDLLTAIMHEMGHALGLNDSYLQQDRDSLMYGYLTKGERRLPAKGQAVGAVPGSLGATPHFLGAPVNIGTLPPNKSVTIKYSVTIGPITTVNPQQISSQGTVSGNFTSVLTDDPTVGGATDPTVTLLGIPPTFTSATSTTFVVGTNGNFNVTANGAPPPTFTKTGALPSNVTLSSAAPGPPHPRPGVA